MDLVSNNASAYWGLNRNELQRKTLETQNQSFVIFLPLRTFVTDNVDVEHKVTSNKAECPG